MGHLGIRPLSPTARSLLEIYERLLEHFGPQDWWPGESPFEVMVGAVLTQNTNWANVEKAIRNLKGLGLLEPKRLCRLKTEELASLIRPAGYYNIKARRLKNLLELIENEFHNDLDLLFSLEQGALREKLLGVRGIGPETADSIILYAARKPVFVVDAYTYRVFLRHGMILDGITYEEFQGLFHGNIEPDERLYNEYHALIVRLCKTYCQKKPKCEPCPIRGIGGEG